MTNQETRQQMKIKGSYKQIDEIKRKEDWNGLVTE